MHVYNGMSAEALEAEYNLVARRGPDFADMAEGWRVRSEAYRLRSGARTDLAYGEGEREKLDFFPGGDPDGPVVIYIHGGYWQRGDKNLYSFVAEAFVRNGVSVAILNYSLTPSVRIGEIPPQIRKAVAWTWLNASGLGFSRDRLFVMGHSAGGHLTAMMMATDWPAFNAALPTGLVRGGIPVSGVFELEPLVHTSLNQGPRMDIAEAIEQSPVFQPPLTNAPQLIAVGGGETAEFLRQSNQYAAQYATSERSMERYDVPEADHFDVLERLAEDDSVFFGKSMSLILDR